LNFSKVMLLPPRVTVSGHPVISLFNILMVSEPVFNGVYVIDNPGGAVIAPFPYLFYNYKNAAGGDSLVFPIQTNPCHGGLQLVAPGAPSSLTSAEYSTLHPPAIISADPLTLSWKVFEFPAARTTSAHTGNALCQWGTGARTFVKQ